MRTSFRPFVTFLVIASLSPAVPAADGKGPPNKNNNNNNRRESPQEKAREQAQKQREQAERLRKAAADLAKEEQAALGAANQEIVDARTSHRTASKTLADAKAKATQDVEKSLGIEKALADMNAAQKAYDQAADPVVKSVRESADYKKAKEKASAAEAAIKAVKEDATLSDVDQRKRVAEFFPKTLAATDLEKQALKDHPTASAASAKLDAAQHRVAELRAKVDEKVEKDDAVRSARQAIEKTTAAMDRAEAKLASVKAQAAAAEKRLQAGIVPRDKDKDDNDKKDKNKKD